MLYRGGVGELVFLFNTRRLILLVLEPRNQSLVFLTEFSAHQSRLPYYHYILKQILRHNIAVKFLNFRTPENFAVIYLKFKQRPNLTVFPQKDANGKANKEDPDQTAPLRAVRLEEQSDLGLHCLPRPICPKT